MTATVSHLSFNTLKRELDVSIIFQLVPRCSIRKSRLASMAINGERKNIPKNNDSCVQRSAQSNDNTP